MPECDYCGTSVDDEEGYLTHLRDEHAGELGPIDRRRIAKLDGEAGFGLPTGPLVLVLVVFAAAALAAYLALGTGGGGDGQTGATDSIETSPLPDTGNSEYLQDVQSYPEQRNDHVELGTPLEYDPMPPVGGRHYGSTISAGYYTEPQSLGALVHTLEHGAVIVYYDPSAMTPEARESLQTYADEHTGTWQSVVVVPTPVEDPDTAYVLTAWRHSLDVEEYDARVIHAFLAEYLGRGPENPVR